MTSSPLRPGASLEDEVDFYKKQYEQLETDLADFQASSKELEEQLERDIETAEKSERKLREQLETLKFEAEEWKAKHKQAKAEANNTQNALQKEITSLRESSRSMQLKLRDVEVMNDDYERQARNTESSLEDLEGKCNVAIERGVLLEEEVRNGEQEREALRIETQRLRDELGDLKVESEITLEKLRLSEKTVERLRSRKPSPLAVASLRPRSAGSEVSGTTPLSPTASTPPPKSESASDAPTPPSPPLSDAPATAKADPKTPIPTKRTSLLPDGGKTLRPAVQNPRGAASKHSRGPSLASNSGLPPSSSDGAATTTTRTYARARMVSRSSNVGGGAEPLPRSESLYQIRNLRGRVQKIEERVHSARSKLPASTNKTGTPTKGSPRVGGGGGGGDGAALPSSVTMRRSLKRPSSNFGVAAQQPDTTTISTSDASQPRPETQRKRLSFGFPRPPSSAASDRPSSALADRPASAAALHRPSSRASLASRSGARSSLAPYASRTADADALSGLPRSSSSLGGSYATLHAGSSVGFQGGRGGTTSRMHRASASVSELRRHAAAAAADEEEGAELPASPTRRVTLDRGTFGAGLGGGSKRLSGGIPLPTPRTPGKRVSTGVLAGMREEGSAGGAGAGTAAGGRMGPPPRRKMSDVGETY